MSTVNAKNVQVGFSGTADQNFTLYQPAAPDGTVRLGVGNSGATTLDAVVVDNSGNVSDSGTVTADGQILAPAGTAVTPAIAFTADSNTGFYNQASGAIGFVCNGNEEFRVDTVGQLWNTVSSQVGTDYQTLYRGYLCRAWVNFNGVGTVAIRASGNVSSITDGGTGIYTVNFTTAMPDVNYAWFGGGNQDAGSIGAFDAVQVHTSDVGSCIINTFGSASTKNDLDTACLSIFR